MARLPEHRPRTRARCRSARRIVSATGRHQFYTVRIEDGAAVPGVQGIGRHHQHVASRRLHRDPDPHRHRRRGRPRRRHAVLVEPCTSITADHGPSRSSSRTRRASCARSPPISRKVRCCSRSIAAPGDPTASAGSVNWQNGRVNTRHAASRSSPSSRQSSVVVRRYVEDTGLPFNILLDVSREVMKAYGVWHRLGLDAWNIARPALFLIDQIRPHPLLVRRRQPGGVPVTAGDLGGAQPIGSLRASLFGIRDPGSGIRDSARGARARGSRFCVRHQ